MGRRRLIDENEMMKWLVEGVIGGANTVTQSHIDTFCLVFIMLAEIYNVIV